MYVRSILWMRIGVGLAGIALPVALWLVDKLYLHGDPQPRDSTSAYYYSGMREVFVTVIFGTGAFLVGYKIAEVNLDNTASIFAGLGAMRLAWFPTKPGGNKIPPPHLTPLQDRWGAGTVRWFHIGGTLTFVSGLAIVSYLFGVREGKWNPVDGKTITRLPFVSARAVLGGLDCGIFLFLAVMWRKRHGADSGFR